MPLTGSPFLQSLGWATLNSFWQFALLWCLYQCWCYWSNPAAGNRYRVAVTAIFTGAAWFIYTCIRFYIAGSEAPGTLRVAGLDTPGWFPAVLTSASLTYLLLLAVPAFKVMQNWRFLQSIRNKGLVKAPFRQRLFVQHISGHLGIKRKVIVYLSDLVTSPVTIGYFKPVILIPVAALTQLSVPQLEAILLHELSHIRRHDYLLNLFLTAIHVVLYFNPFVKLFINAVETEREHCCDELVLQFEYDKVSYASALLQLEKTNHHQTELAMAATQKNNLLHRIERIVGVKRKSSLKANHFLGAFAALLLLLTINSMIIAGRQHTGTASGISHISQPFAHFISTDKADLVLPAKHRIDRSKNVFVAHANSTNNMEADLITPMESTEAPELADGFIHVAFTDADALSEEQKTEVKKTLNKTRKVLSANWPSVERNIIDGMLPSEKEMARKEYLQEVANIDWQRMEQNMKAGYEKIDFEKVHAQLNNQIATARIDSVCSSYQAALSQLRASCGALPVPDASVQQLHKVQEQLQQQIIELKKLKEKKTIKL